MRVFKANAEKSREEKTEKHQTVVGPRSRLNSLRKPARSAFASARLRRKDWRFRALRSLRASTSALYADSSWVCR